MKRNTILGCYCGVLLSTACCYGDSVKVSFDLKGAETIDRLAADISLTHDLSVTCIGKDMQDGYIIAAKLRHMGVMNTIYLDGMKKPSYSAKGLPVVRLTNFKLSPRLKAQIAGYNLCMMTAHVEKKKQAEAAASDR